MPRAARRRWPLSRRVGGGSEARAPGGDEWPCLDAW